MSAAITAAVVGVAGTAYNQKQQSKAQKKAAEAQNAANGGGGEGAAGAANMQSWSDIDRVNDLNRENAIWTQRQNAIAADTAFGSTSYDIDPKTGLMKAKQSLNATDQANLDAMRGKQGAAIGGMQTGFNVNNDVMKAMQAQLQPGQDLARNKENARLAAMGLGSGSGSAWGNSQDALNRSQNDANQKAVLGGFDAWNTEQANNRANLSAGNAFSSNLHNNAPTLLTPQVAQPTVAQPQNRTFEGWAADQAQANRMYNQDMDAASAQAKGTQNIWGSVAGLAGNKDLMKGVTDWWNTPSSPTPSDSNWMSNNYGYGEGGA